MNHRTFKNLMALILVFGFSNAQNLISRSTPSSEFPLSPINEEPTFSIEDLKLAGEKVKLFVLRQENNVGCLHCHLGGLLGKKTDSSLDQILKKFISTQLKELSKAFQEIKSRKADSSEESYMKDLEKVASALFKKLSGSDYKVISAELKKEVKTEKYRFRAASDRINRALYAAIFELQKEITQECFVFLMELAGYIELVIQQQLLEKGLCGKEYKKLQLPIMAPHDDL